MLLLAYCTARLYVPAVLRLTGMENAPLVTLPVPIIVFPFLIVMVPIVTGLLFLSFTVPVMVTLPTLLPFA